VRTSIDKEDGQTLTDQDINNRVVVSVQKFNGKTMFAEPKQTIPMWVYIAGGAALVLLIVLAVLLWRQRREEEEEEEEMFEQPVMQQIPDIHEEHEKEATMRRKQLERLAKEKPDEFAKLLRTWLSEE
jgi:flagellar M-ring protein FliF